MDPSEKPLIFKPKKSGVERERGKPSEQEVIQQRAEIEASHGFFDHLLGFLRKIDLLRKFLPEEKVTGRQNDPIETFPRDKADRFRRLFSNCSLDREYYGIDELTRMGIERSDILNNFLSTAYTIIRFFQTYAKLSESNAYNPLLDKFKKKIKPILDDYRARKFEIIPEQLFSDLFDQEIVDAIRKMIKKLPVRSRRNLFALLHTIHDTIEYPPFDRWMKSVKAVGDRNPTTLTLDSDNFCGVTLCSQSEIDHKDYSARREGLVVNDFLLFEPNDTSTCLCIRPARAQNGDYFVPGMLYTMDGETDSFLSGYLGPWKKRVVIEKGTFTFVRALSTKDLEKLKLYSQIKKVHKNLNKKQVE